MKDQFEKDRPNNMLILSMIDNANSILAVSFIFIFFTKQTSTSNCYMSRNRTFDSFVLQLCIDRHDTDKPQFSRVRSPQTDMCKLLTYLPLSQWII